MVSAGVHRSTNWTALGWRNLEDSDYMMRTAFRKRAALPKHQRERIIDVKYTDFVADKAGTACRVAEAMQRVAPVGEAKQQPACDRAAIQASIDADFFLHRPFGKHRYALEDFGLTREAVHEAMRYYEPYWK